MSKVRVHNMSVSLEPLKQWNVTTKSFGPLSGSVVIEAASFSGDPLAVSDQIDF